MVTMWQAFINFWKGYVNFTGRSTRAEFWWMRLWSTIIFFVWAISFAFAIVGDSAFIAKVDKYSQPNVQGIENWKLISELMSAPFTMIVLMIGALIALAMILPNIALTIRRYRDAGTKTWIAWVVWVFSAFVGRGIWSHNEWQIMVSISGIFGLIGFILSVLPSDTLTGTGFIGRPKEQKLVFKEDYTDSSDDEL